MYVMEVERERPVVYFELRICQKYLAASPAIAKTSAPLKDAKTLAMPRQVCKPPTMTKEAEKASIGPIQTTLSQFFDI
jgi:hypothetical protein